MELGGFSFDLPSLSKGRGVDPSELYDLLILGGGPAAMSAAVYAARKMLKVAILTKELGGQVAYTSEVENYLGFQSIDGKELVGRFKEHVLQFDIPVGRKEVVTNVTDEETSFEVTTESGGAFRSRTVIVATGKRDRPLNVPGERELIGKGVAYCATCDAPFFKDKNVVVAGGGNSAFTAVLDLLKLASHVTAVNFAPGWQADEVLQVATRKSEKLELLDSHQITRIEGEQRVTAVKVKDRVSEKERSLPADGIFIEIGLLPNSDPVRGLVKTTPAGEVQVDCLCRTSVPGLFGAGDVTTVPEKQIIISAGEGAKAALSAYSYLTQRGLI